ncbi:MAG: ATP-dependent Lon protease [Actinomycetota bacterium]|nr:ATP-dependent Lon protease [Actinomycetota bacterium]
MTDKPAVPMPMFPLGTVLFPYAPLPLHVFEARYRQLTEDCLRGNNEFGVVLIERGHEVGGGDARYGVGTVARIVEAASFPDGRWALITIGDRRIRIRTWLPDDPYPVALVEDLDDGPFDPADLTALGGAERTVRRALALQAELEEPSVPATAELDGDPERAAYQLAAFAPIGPADKQEVLEASTWRERINLVAELAAAAGEMFAYRLSAG